MEGKKQPKKEDYGWQDGGIAEETGWMIEGGEEAFYKALGEYNSSLCEKPNEPNNEVIPEPSYKRETYESLKASLMGRFEKMYHASEERYADEAAKMFAWMIDSWKREEEDWREWRKEYEQSLIREDKLRIQNLNILADVKKLHQYLKDGEILKGESWMIEFPQFCQELNINRA